MDCEKCDGSKCTNCTKQFPVGMYGESSEDYW